MGLLHSSILNATPDVKVVAMCEKSNLVRRFGAHAFKDITIVEQVNQLASFSLDCIFVTTPPRYDRETHWPM